jgi:hypothetical protein
MAFTAWNLLKTKRCYYIKIKVSIMNNTNRVFITIPKASDLITSQDTHLIDQFVKYAKIKYWIASNIEDYTFIENGVYLNPEDATALKLRFTV